MVFAESVIGVMSAMPLFSPELVGVNEISAAGLVAFEGGAPVTHPAVWGFAGVGIYNVTQDRHTDKLQLFLVNYAAWHAVMIVAWLWPHPSRNEAGAEESSLKLSVGPGGVTFRYRF